MIKPSDLIYGILPPYILEHLAEHGEPAQKEKARRTMEITAQFKAERMELKPMGPAAAPLAAAVAGKQRKVYTADFGSSLPGRLVRQEGEAASSDQAVDEAYDGTGATYDLFWDIYQRNSIDNNGMALISTVHYMQGYDNAFWDGVQMVYGDGDEDLPPAKRLFNRFTIAIDVTAHELAHGVTQYTANLTYASQPGALNESFSDVFGSLVKQRKLNQDALAADWIIGEGLFTPNVNGVGIRSMKAPGTAYDDPSIGKDPQPAHMKDYVNTLDDNGGVHINSGIPNHAFYLAAVDMGGYAWEKAGKIWWLTLRDKLGANDNFQAAADKTFATAGELYGVDSPEQLSVAKGWAGVGITIGGNAQNPGCFTSLLKAIGLR